MSAENTNAGGGEPVTILYTNWRGETAVRRIMPHPVPGAAAFWFGATSYHTEPQWLVLARDADKGEDRDFALSGIKAWGQEAVDAALSAQSTGSAGVAAEPVAWAWEYRSASGRFVPVSGFKQPGAVNTRNIRPLYDHPPVAAEPVALREAASMAAMYLRTGFINCERCGHEQSTKDTDALYTLDEALAAAPTPPAGGGETKAHPICDRPTLYDRGECCGKTPCASPASPAGDLISLSAGATPGPWSDAMLMGEPTNRKLASALVNAYRSGRLIEAAPAAPRKGPSEEEIDKLYNEISDVMYSADVLFAHPAHRSLKRLHDLAILTPADRGETQAVGDGWQPISTAPKDGTLIGVAGGCANWNEDGQYWYTAVGYSIGRPIEWEVTHWKSLDPATIPSPDQNRGEPDQGGANTEAGR